MISLSVFDLKETPAECRPSHKDVIVMLRDTPDIIIDKVPQIDYHKVGSEKFKDEISTIKSYLNRPVNDKLFNQKCDKDPEIVFKEYCEDNHLSVNFKKIKNLCDQLKTIIKREKFKYKRPRPFNFIKKADKINSPAYPSGHTAKAFFIAALIESEYPQHSIKLNNLADRVAVSRLDLGLHYPSDCELGKLIGQICAYRVKTTILP